MEVIPGTKINLHPLRATSRARFRPSSLSPHCREPSRVRRFVNDTLMLVHLKAFCVKTNLIRIKRFYRTCSCIRLRRKDKEVQRKKGLLNLDIFLPTKTFGGLGFSTTNGFWTCFTALFVLGKILCNRWFTPSSKTLTTITYFVFFFRRVL